MFCCLFALLLLTCCVSRATSSNNSLCLTGASPFQISNFCAPGWYCPLYNASDPATYPVQCAATDDCTLDRLATKFCGRQGTYEPMLCREKYFCPSPVEEIECPEGHYCPMGQHSPIKCHSMTSCPKGSSKKFEWSSMIALIIGDFAALLGYYLAMSYRARQQKIQKDRCAVIPLHTSPHELVEEINNEVDDVELASKANDSISHVFPPITKRQTSTEILCEGFERARGNLPHFFLQFDQLSLKIPLKDKRIISVLAGVTGSLQPGKVTAIMGPSGAGNIIVVHLMVVHSI